VPPPAMALAAPAAKPPSTMSAMSNAVMGGQVREAGE
jgi:hypothetical protein